MSTNRPRITGDGGTDVFRQTVEPAAGPYNMNPADDCVLGGAGGAQVVTLPPTARIHVGDVAKVVGAFGTVTLTANAGQTVNGGATLAIASGGAEEVTWDGISNWVPSGAAGAGGAIALAGDVNGLSNANHVDNIHGPGAGVAVGIFVNLTVDKGVVAFVLSQGQRTDAAGGQPFATQSQSVAVGSGGSSGDYHVQLGYTDVALNGARKIFFDANQTQGGGAVVNLGFFDSLGRLEVAGGTSSAPTAIGAAISSTTQAGVHFNVGNPANTTGSTHAIGGNSVSTHVNAPNQTLVTTAGLFFEILGNPYFQLLYASHGAEPSGLGKFRFLANNLSPWYGWDLVGSGGANFTQEHYITSAQIETTNATPTLFQTGAGATKNIPIPADSGANGIVVSIKVKVLAQSETTSGGVTKGDTWSAEYVCTVKNVAGAISIVGSSQLWHVNDASLAALAVTFQISTTNLQLLATGIAAITIDWQAHPLEVTIK